MIGWTYPSFLVNVGEHDDATRIFFPHHSPEVVDCVWQRTLSRYVQCLLLVALPERERERERGEKFSKEIIMLAYLNVVGIDKIRSFHAGNKTEMNPRFIIWIILMM